MKHNLLSLFFAAIVAMNVYAADVWDGSSDIFTHGAGTEQSPYLIENAEQLAFIAEMVNAGVYTYSGNYFKLTTDLDLKNIPWTPIGETEEHQFGGSFDGNNHTISNLYISSATNAGLFGVVSGGTYKKISIQGEIPSSANATNAGGLIANATSAISIDICSNNVNIEGGSNVGGIIGKSVNLNMSNCVNRANITGTNNVGGLIGTNTNNTTSQIVNCINFGEINGGGIVGGIAGFLNNVELESCKNNGNVTYNYNWSYNKVKTKYSTINYGGYSFNCTYKQTYYDMKCDIEAHVGGIVGKVLETQILRCINIATVSGTLNSNDETTSNLMTRDGSGMYNYNGLVDLYSYTININYDIGGISGYVEGKMVRCTNYGKVSLHESHKGNRWGSVHGDYSAAEYYDFMTKYFQANYTQSRPFGQVVSFVDNTSKNSGGIAGTINGTSFVQLCCNHGDILETGSGIAGVTSNSTTITYVYNVGGVKDGISSNANVTNSYNAGSTTNLGLSSGTVTNSYYINGSGNGTQKTEAQMKSASMPILLNADSTVFIQDIKPNVNKGYPIFKNGMKYIATNDASDVSYTSATLHGNYYNCAPLSMGFEYKEDTATNYISQTVSNASSAQYELTNLTQGTTYVARYWLIDDGIKYFGDTIHFTTLACPTKPVRSDTVRLCQGESYEFAGKTLTQTGVYHDSLEATTGCDSVIELVLQVTETYKYPRTETIERGESYDFYGQLLTEPGVYNEYIRTTNRCNWIELTLIVHEPDKTLTLNVNNPLWGSVVGAGTFEHGTVAEFSAIPAEGCYFVNWSDGDTNAERAILLTKDTTITANFAISQYTITTQATNGTITGGGTYNYGTQVNLTAVADEHYHFVRWSDGDVNATRQITVTENKTYTAIFEKDKFLVLFKDDDGTVLKRDSIEYGVIPTAPTNPTKESTAQYEYSFGGWNPMIVEVTQNATYTATYTSTIRSYTVKFLNEDGSEISSVVYQYGQTPVAPTNPTKTSTAEFTYTFAGWDKPIAQVQGDQTYRATFNATKNSYTITWQNEDGSLIDQTTVEYGVVPTHADPVKENTAEYTYTFTGWTPAVVAVTGNATYRATFNATKNSYTITWQNEDGSLIDQTTVEYGIVPTHAVPVKQNTAEYTYTFAGWTPNVVAVTGEATYRATFNAAKNSYTITWQNEDGSLMDQTMVEYGIVPTHADPVKQNTAEYTYTFAGWTPEVVAVTGNATYRATFNATKNSYTITWQNEDGSLIDQTTVEYGIVPTHADPVKLNTAEYTYTFAGWTPAVVAVTGDATYKATFLATKNSYTITWQDENGSLIDQTTVEYGVVPTHAEPTKQATAEYTYTFAGWTPVVVAVTGNATYKATFTATKNSYTITWQNEDGSLIDQTTVEYGVVPTHTDPIKQNTAEYTYTFSGWTPGVVAVTGNATYRATFSATKNSYTITWQDENGSLIDQTTVEYGVVSTHAEPTKQATAEYTYTFAGWTPVVVVVTGDATYRATFSATKNKYLITFRNDDGTVLKSEEVEYGMLPIAPATPTKESTAQYNYEFAGWTPSVTLVSQAATYTATYNSSVREYLVTFLNDDNSIISMQSCKYGSYPTIPSTPTKQATAEFSYTFAGWTPNIVAVSGDVTYKATFNATKNSYTITWQDEKGALIDQTTVEYGIVPTHADPIKQNTAEYTYTFAGWTPAVVAVTGNATYKATFTAAKNSYTITWQDENGSLIDQTTVEYGQIPAHADPVKQNTAEYTYTFAGWTPDVVAVTSDATYKATFTATKNSYTITWQNEDGSLIDQTTVEYGVVPTHTDPVKQATAEYTYTFSGWTPAVVAVTSDATYKATFSSVVNVYTISVSAVNGQVIGGGEYQYGATIDLTAIPNEGYVFDQWSDGVTDNPRTITVTGDAEYTALFTSTEGFENIYTSEPVQKVIIDQKVYILRGDKTYTLTGQEIK